MNKKEMHNLSPNGVDLTKGNDAKNNNVKNNDEVYTIPNEEACSAEFSQGCIIMDDLVD